jgi:hypothetical protein
MAKKSPPKNTAPSTGFGLRDLFHSLLIGLVAAVLLVLVGTGISLAINPKLLENSGAPLVAAIQATPLPPTSTPTEIPCLAQEWWDAARPGFETAVSQFFNTSLETNVPDIQTWKAALKVWRTEFELTNTPPPCLESTKQALLNASAALDSYFNLYVTVSTEKERGLQGLAVYDALLVVGDELAKQNVTVSEPWYQTAVDFTRAECPAARWFIEQIALRDYNTFFEESARVNIGTMNAGELNDLLRRIRSLRSSLATDKPNFPACTQPVTDALIAAFDGMIGALNNALNGDMAAAQTNLVAMNAAVTNFQVELAKIAPETASGDLPLAAGS